jgi:hypothetical protein
VIQNYKQNQKKLQPLHTCSVWYWIPGTELQAAWKVCKLRRCPSKRPTQARKFITHVYARLWKGKGGLNTEGADRKGRLKKEDFEKSVTPSCLDDKAIYVKALLVTYLGDWRDWPPAWNDTYTMRCWWGRPARGKLHPHMATWTALWHLLSIFLFSFFPFQYVASLLVWNSGLTVYYIKRY